MSRPALARAAIRAPGRGPRATLALALGLGVAGCHLPLERGRPPPAERTADPGVADPAPDAAGRPGASRQPR